jgi:hypothetical protein
MVTAGEHAQQAAPYQQHATQTDIYGYSASLQVMLNKSVAISDSSRNGSNTGLQREAHAFAAL